MRYMLIHAADPDLASQWDDEADASFSSWVEETIRSGINLQGGRLRPTADATTVKIRSGELVITDGPFAETKEQVAGYDLLECASLDEAVRWAAGTPAPGRGRSRCAPCRSVPRPRRCPRRAKARSGT